MKRFSSTKFDTPQIQYPRESIARRFFRAKGPPIAQHLSTTGFLERAPLIRARKSRARDCVELSRLRLDDRAYLQTSSRIRQGRHTQHFCMRLYFSTVSP